MFGIGGIHRIHRIHRIPQIRLPGAPVVARGPPAANGFLRRRRTGVRNQHAAACSGATPHAIPDAIPDAIPADVTRLDPRSVVRRMGTIISFAIPILLVPIADPLMSLVDVIFLGQFSTSLNVAGLSPATLIFNFLFCTIMLTRPPIDIDAAHSLLSLPGYPLARPQTVSRRSPLPPWRPWRISSDKARTTRLDSS